MIFVSLNPWNQNWICFTKPFDKQLFIKLSTKKKIDKKPGYTTTHDMNHKITTTENKPSMVTEIPIYVIVW